MEDSKIPTPAEIIEMDKLFQIVMYGHQMGYLRESITQQQIKLMEGVISGISLRALDLTLHNVLGEKWPRLIVPVKDCPPDK